MKLSFQDIHGAFITLMILFQGIISASDVPGTIQSKDVTEVKTSHPKVYLNKSKKRNDLDSTVSQIVTEVKHHMKKNDIPNIQREIEISRLSELGSTKGQLSTFVSNRNEIGIIKRGFLANLATLLNDADNFATQKNESGISSVLEKSVKASEIEPRYKQNTTIPPLSQVEKELNVTENEYAPIFAYFKGKIVPLGKLPNTSFKRSHNESNQQAMPSTRPVSHEHTAVKDVTGQLRHEIPERNHLKSFTRTGKSHVIFEDKSDTVNEDTTDNKISKLQQYLTNLDGHVADTGISKDIRGVAKDEVVFPTEINNPTQKSDIIDHVKGFVLDDGKVVRLSAKSDVLQDKQKLKSSTSANSLEKFYIADDENMYPLTKSKPMNADAVTRDTTTKDGNTEPKTVAVSLDMLKELLKKTDTKISLAQLLNKGSTTGDSKSEVSAEEDPGTIEDFAAGGLKSHNEYREKHHDSDLIWSDDLASKAQKLAESLADKKTLEIAKDLEKEGYGENVAKVWATFKDAGEAAAKMWYQQSDNYRFDDPHLDENTGQFAQMVWKNTKELGMGVAKSIDDVNNKYVYVVALYRPPGNIEAQLRENVLPTGNNTVDVYTTFFKRSQAINTSNLVSTKRDWKRSHLGGQKLII